MEREAQFFEAQSTRLSAVEALPFAIRAAELYMAAAVEASSKPAAARLRRNCQRLIHFAENLKAQLSTSSTAVPFSSSADILRQASFINGNYFPPWHLLPSENENECLAGDIFTDDATYSLSPAQAENFSAWSRLGGLLSHRSGLISPRTNSDLMQLSSRCDLVQDIATDCSVVASLSAAVRVLAGSRLLLSSIMVPFDHKERRPMLSPVGKYIFRLNFNGCFRRVVVDDLLPTSKSKRALFVIDNLAPSSRWPALLEKAYLKVRGGYDFPGSNSATDLWVITGWIPEQVSLQREDLNLGDLWTRLRTAYDAFDVIVTLGTGRVSVAEQQVLGLVGEHDYAVEALDTSCNSPRRVLIKNPWCDAPWIKQPMHHNEKCFGPRTKWMDLKDVAQHFEYMYMNWNPKLFSHRWDSHFKWQTPPKCFTTSLIRNPQYLLSSPQGGPAWVLISRHFQDAELSIARERRVSSASEARQLGFMSILVYDNAGRRVQVRGAETYRGPYVDSPQTLARLHLRAGKHYTIVIDKYDFPLSLYTFTISIFSNDQIQVSEVEEKLPCAEERLGTWSRDSAGGNSFSSMYYKNPQFRLSIDRETPLTIMLCSEDSNIHVHVDLIRARHGRVSSIGEKDLVGSSGEYRRGCATADIPLLGIGIYTLVCSTFNTGQVADFAVRVASAVPVTMASIPAYAAGQLRIPLNIPSVLVNGTSVSAQLRIDRMTQVEVWIRSKPSNEEARQQPMPMMMMLRVSILEDEKNSRHAVAVSGEGKFEDLSATITVPKVDLKPKKSSRLPFWLRIEVQGSQSPDITIRGELLSDLPVEIGEWRRDPC